MPTIQKTTAGTETIHNVGRVAGGETIDVPADTAAFLVEETAKYDYVENDETDAQSDSDTDGGEDTTDDDTDAEGDETALEDRTYQELRDLASEHDISGRSDMDKADLVDALAEVV